MIFSRRKFFGFMAAAPVAAKTAAQELAKAETQALAHPNYGLDYTTDSQEIYPTPDENTYWSEHAARLRKRLLEINEQKNITRNRINARRTLNRLDPDIACCRSLSLSAKIRLQSERDVDRLKDNEEQDLLKSLAHAMERISS